MGELLAGGDMVVVRVRVVGSGDEVGGAGIPFREV